VIIHVQQIPGSGEPEAEKLVVVAVVAVVAAVAVDAVVG
jgi:hypothetical protein